MTKSREDTVTLNLRNFPAALYRQLKIQAAKDDVYVKDLIAAYLQAHLKYAKAEAKAELATTTTN